MNLLVLSDLHIDTHDNFGIFQWTEMDFIMQIELLRDHFAIDKVIFNGDTFELFKYTFDEIKEANPIIMDYFRDKDFIFIKGNHDMLNDLAVDHYQILNSKGQSIYIEHGHNADWLDGTKIGRALCKFGFLLLKKLSRYKSLLNLYFKIVAINDHVNHIPKKYNTIKYLTYALKLLKEHDVVIFGHTHKLESHKTYYLNTKKRYINSGTCSLGRFQAVVMDTETLKYELIKESKDSIKKKFKKKQVEKVYHNHAKSKETSSISNGIIF